MQDYLLTINCNDRDFKPNFNCIVYFATEMLFKPNNVGMLYKQDNDFNFEEKRTELAEEFIDLVFDEQSKLEKKEYISEVANKAQWLFDSEQIRKKIGYNM